MDNISVSMIVVTLWETFGWLFVVGVVIGALLVAMLAQAWLRCRRLGQPVARFIWQGILTMLVVAAIITPFVPLWTMAPVGDLLGLVDYVLAYVMALAPAAVLGVFWIYLRSARLSKVS